MRKVGYFWGRRGREKEGEGERGKGGEGNLVRRCWKEREKKKKNTFFTLSNGIFWRTKDVFAFGNAEFSVEVS